MLVSDGAFWWSFQLPLVGFVGCHVGGSLLTPKHICQHASSFWARHPNQSFFVFFFSVIFLLTYHDLCLNSIVPVFQLKANQFVYFDLCLCAPRLHHIHHRLGSLPKFYVATLRVDISGGGCRKGTEEGKGWVCVNGEKKGKRNKKIIQSIQLAALRSHYAADESTDCQGWKEAALMAQHLCLSGRLVSCGWKTKDFPVELIQNTVSLKYFTMLHLFKHTFPELRWCHTWRLHAEFRQLLWEQCRNRCDLVKNVPHIYQRVLLLRGECQALSSREPQWRMQRLRCTARQRLTILLHSR